MPDQGAPVLILAPIGRDAAASAELLAKAGIATRICGSLPELVDALPSAAAVFVAEEALFGRELGPLFACIEQQPAWSDLPFVILTSRRHDLRVATWRQDLIIGLRNASLLERPIHAITLSSSLRAAVRGRRRQHELRILLEARERAATELERKVEEATAELRQQMADRARMEETLRQAQKLEAVGQLTGGIAHDFNNLLMVILAGLELISRHRDSERFDSFVENMRNAAMRGASLTRQLLAFARRQPLKAETIALADRISDVRELLDRSLGANIRLVTEVPSDLWPVDVDANELELVLLNLAFNARDAMPDGGTISVRCENLPSTSAGMTSDMVRITVADTGTGMPPEVVARAFEPFFTTKEIGKGSGLGLAQAYGFARQSGGMVRIESKVGEGTRVVLLLPRSANHPPRRPATMDAAHAASGGTVAGQVLLVEDDEEVARLVAEMLEQLGYEVLRVANATSALGALANGRSVDVVLSDIMMPGGMDGVGLARELRVRRPDLPVVLITGHPEAARLKEEAEQLKVLAKPFRIAELRAVLSHVTGAPV